MPAGRRRSGHRYFHRVGEKNSAAVVEGAQAVRVLIPSLGDGLEARETARPAIRAAAIKAFRAADAPSVGEGQVIV